MRKLVVISGNNFIPGTKTENLYFYMIQGKNL